MAPLDAIDHLVALPLGEAGALPPNRLRIRVGVGNRLLFNRGLHRRLPVPFWLAALGSGAVRLDSRILDVGCGCGRFAMVLRDLDWYGTRFTGRYTGVDVDAEAIGWCRANFPVERYEFLLSPARSAAYHPQGPAGPPPPLPVSDASQDFIFANSLLTHLLEEELVHMLGEAQRALAPGGTMQMTVFCLDHLAGAPGGLGGRWSFRHERGAARIENPRCPEAAVAYEADFLLAQCRRAGFESVELRPGRQSLLAARRPGGAGAAR